MGIFKFDLGATVRFSMSNEVGEVIGRAEYAYAENAYLIRYVAADGRQVQDWVDGSALQDVAAT